MDSNAHVEVELGPLSDPPAGQRETVGRERSAWTGELGLRGVEWRLWVKARHSLDCLDHVEAHFDATLCVLLIWLCAEQRALSVAGRGGGGAKFAGVRTHLVGRLRARGGKGLLAFARGLSCARVARKLTHRHNSSSRPAVLCANTCVAGWRVGVG